MRSTARRTLGALPTLFRIGVAETVAYRAEFLVWMLTSTMPLINLALWSTVAREAPFRGYSSADFVAYFLANMIVRNMTGNWVAWQMSEEIRTGTMAMRMLRPVHPFVALAASQGAALPLRSLVALPIAVILLVSSGASSLTGDPVQLAALVPSILLAWLLTFAILFAIGTASFWITQSMAIANLYFGAYSLLSGYLMPLELMGPVGRIAMWLPFRYMLSAPIELMIKRLSHEQVLELLAGQVAWAVILLTCALALWRRGVRRFEAVGS
jgi:ABC-2 type transport system permease protein